MRCSQAVVRRWHCLCIQRLAYEVIGSIAGKQAVFLSLERMIMKANPPTNTVAALSRRSFLRTTTRGLSAAALFGAMPRGWVGNVYASDAPETAALRFGIIALTDCSPIVIAHEKELFKKYGIQSTVAKGANWAAIRDSLSSGANQ